MSTASPPSFDWHEFLVRLIERLDAAGGAAWIIDQRQLQIGVSIGGHPPQSLSAGSWLQRRHECLTDVLRNKRAAALEVDDSANTEGARSATLLFAPVTRGDILIGFAEIAYRQRLAPQQCPSQLELLEQLCRLSGVTANTVLERPISDNPPPTTDAPVDWTAVLEFLRQVQRGQRLHDVAGAIANECRLLFDADRVSIAVPHGKRVRILAVSGQDRVQRQANLIQAMSRLTKLILATKEPFLFTGGLEEVPAPLEHALAEFTQLSGARMVLVVPLLSSDDATKPHPTDELASPNDRRTVAGALIIEQMQHSQPQPRLKVHLDLVRDHVSMAMTHARRYESIFLLPVWTAVGGWWSALYGRRLAWTTLLVIALAGVITALFVVPWRYRIDAKGQLMPVVQRDVFAPWDGQVMELLTRGGDRVAAGQPLVQLRNDTLEEDLVKARGELAEKRKLAAALLAQLDEAGRSAPREEETRLSGKVAETEIEIEGLRERIAHLSQHIRQLVVCSPITGIVTTFQAEQLLLNRPVQRGDLLIQVMDDRGEWRLELDVPEQRLGHLVAARANAGPQLPIAFRLLTHPEDTYQAQLSDIGTRSVTSEAQGSVIELRATVDAAAIKRTSIGAQVRARIDCGEKPLGYCLFGDVIEFVQKYLWW